MSLSNVNFKSLKKERYKFNLTDIIFLVFQKTSLSTRQAASATVKRRNASVHQQNQQMNLPPRNRRSSKVSSRRFSTGSRIFSFHSIHRWNLPFRSLFSRLKSWKFPQLVFLRFVYLSHFAIFANYLRAFRIKWNFLHHYHYQTFCFLELDLRSYAKKWI